ncbi:MAG: AAA family ATPase [Anaerolineae bacterium]|nr:AAA family ATPase [Anaerolineae bacterium]
MITTLDLTAALERAHRAQAILEEQAAGYTALTIPVHLKLDLEAKRREVADLEARLNGAATAPASTPTFDQREQTVGTQINVAGDYHAPPPLAREEVLRGPAAPLLNVLNPFLDRGRINDPARLFDRRRILRELRQMLAAGNSISLVGEQAIGKSSLLVHLYQTRAEWLPDITVIYLDLLGMVNEKDFCAEVLEGLGEEPEGGLRRFKRVLRRSRTLLLLDEVEKLTDPAFSSRLHDLLRALAQEPSLTLAVASHSPLVEVFPPTSSTSPFHNIFTEKRLGPFDPGDARAFLAQRLAATGMTFTPEEQQQLVVDSGGHPAHLQRRAYDLFEQKRR